MELDLTTVIFEALNFLILVWLLKRFFYQPVLAVIAQRQAASEKIIVDAENVRRDADALQVEYNAKLQAVAGERVAARLQLDEEIAAAREQQLATLAAEAEAERARQQLLLARAQRATQQTLERQALGVATRFASHFLERLSGPALDARLADLALEELAARSPQQLAELCRALQTPAASLRIVSAWPLDLARREAFAAALSRLAGQPVTPEFAEDATLKAGVCLSAGAWVLMANVRDELAFFSEANVDEV